MRKEKKYHYIYKTTNLKNGKFYVGMHSTYNLNDSYLGSGTVLRRSIRRNGIENFKIEYLEFFDNRVDLANREKELVNEDLLKDPMCINLRSGGVGGWTIEQQKKNSIKGNAKKDWLWENDKVWAEKMRDSMSKSLKGKQVWWIGKNHSEETKQKIGKESSLKQKGENNSQFGTCWITNGTENKKGNKTDRLLTGWRFGRTIKNKTL
jgi:group I intron endonuclease